jgi:hypothetical protein
MQQTSETTGAAWRYRVGIADPTQRQAVEALRRAAYRQANEFDWNDEATLGWSAADDAGTVLALWDARWASGQRRWPDSSTACVSSRRCSRPRSVHAAARSDNWPGFR